MNILIFHSRQTGDVVRSSHCARLLKKKYPNSFITYVTNPLLVPLIETCEWIDMCIDQPFWDTHDLVSQEDLSRTKHQWAFDDLYDLRSFEKLRDDWQPDLAFYPRWNPSERPVPYGPNYVFRCFASCCGLTEEEAKDTAYELDVETEETQRASDIWFKHCVYDKRILLHMDNLDNSFRRLKETHNALELNTKGTWRESLCMIHQADVVVSRFGGVTTLAAAVDTPVIEIPKPEPTFWASPIYSHPGKGHVLLLPERRCDLFEGTDEHRLQPCTPSYAAYTQERCVMGFANREGVPFRDSYHCWRQVTVDQVEKVLEEIA